MTSRRPEHPKIKQRPSGSYARVSLQRNSNDHTLRDLERAASGQSEQGYLFRLFITGTTPASARAVEQVRNACEEHLAGRYELHVIDIYQKPSLARQEQIIATPTLIRTLPAPVRRYIGDFSRLTGSLFENPPRERS